MARLNRREFVLVAGASLVTESILKDVPLAKSQIHGGGENPFSAAVEKLDAMTGEPITDWKWHIDNLPHPEDPALDVADWQNFRLPPGPDPFRNLDDVIVGKGPVWFRARIEIPKTLGGYPIEGLPIKLDLRINNHGHGPIRFYSNGELMEMTPTSAQEPISLMSQAKAGQEFVIAAFCPDPGALIARLEVAYPPGKSNPENMRDEILCVQTASTGFPEGQSEREAQLRAAVQTIDFTALDRGDKDGFDSSLAAADAKMRPLADWIRQFTIRAVGNSHIDLAWLWGWEETVEAVRDTFTTAMDLMDEYPGTFYAQSSAQDFLWLERYYPPEFERIRQFVKQGRWELVGGMWCEPDLNMPCGESLVRQLLTGKRYEIDVGWMVYAGFDPVEYMTMYPGRFPELHVKEIKIGTKPFANLHAGLGLPTTEVGRGEIDWKRIFAAARKGGMKHSYVEQETFPDMPMMEALKADYDYLHSLKV